MPYTTLAKTKAAIRDKPVLSIIKLCDERNTFYVTYKDKSYAYRLHFTDVVTYTPNRIILNSGGYKTSTTKERMNSHFTIGNIFQKHFQWYVQMKDGNTYPYYDGITFDYSGKLINESLTDNLGKLKQIELTF
jgi:hypothetical protein